MSKFFTKAKNEASSSEESSSESEEETKQTNKAAAPTKAKKFYNSDDESEEEDRKVIHTTDKRTSALQDVFDKMKNHIKIDDFVSLQTDFDLIQTEMEKCVGTVFATDKFQTLPSWVLRAFISLEDCVNEVTPEIKKKMNKLNAQAFTKVKQKLKKYFTETGDNENFYLAQVEKFRANPVEEEAPPKKASKKAAKDKESESSSDDDSDSDSDSDDSSSEDDSSGSDKSEKPKKKTKEEPKKEKKKADSSSEEKSSSENDSSGSSSGSDDSDSDMKGSDSEEDDEKIEVVKEGELPKKYAFLALPHEEKTPQQRRWKWVMFDCLPEDMKKFVRPPKKESKDDDKKQKKQVKDEDKAEVEEQQLDFIDDRDLDYSKLDNVETVLNKYKNQQISRRNFDPQLQITVLNLILTAQATNKNVKVEVLMLLVSTYFASAKQSTTGFFSRDTWLITNTTISLLLTTLQTVQIEDKTPKIVEKKDDGGDLDLFLSSNDSQIQPALVNFIDKLDQQLTKAFQTLSPTSMEYLLRLRDECLLIQQCDELMKYLEQFSDPVKVARVGLIKLDHVYYKNDQIYAKTKLALKGKPDKLKELYCPSEPTDKLINDLVTLIIANCDKKMKIKATLLQVYHHAIHNRFNEAKDLLGKSKISSIVGKQPIAIQIYYNRAIVQIGLAAFKLGLFEECNAILVDVCQSPKLKESLAQGTSNFSRQQEKTLEEEIEEKKRFIPQHLHVNLELVDCVYMTTSMLLEVPNLSQNKFTIQKSVINRNFRKLIEQYDLKGIQFAAQNSRDFIVFAARFLHQSRWQDCFDSICQIKIFNKMSEFQTGSIKEALKEKIKEVSLRIFLLESQNQHESFGVKAIQDLFELKNGPIFKVTSKLIAKGDISAKIEQSSNTVIFEQKESQVGTLPSNNRKEMEYLQMSHLDKIWEMVENNDRCIELLINQNHYISSSKDKGKESTAHR